MEELIKLLRDGRARTIPMLAAELKTSEADVLRQIEYLEHMGMIRRVIGDHVSCNGCTGCSPGNKRTCSSCMPEGGFKNMGQMWEVV